MNFEKYTVIRDTREQSNNGWWFPESSYCLGTKIGTLKTGDYSLIGLEDIFAVERKKNTSEFSQNINEKRFFRELERMDKFEHPFLVLEFTLADIYSFPRNSGIPSSKWKYLKVTPNYILKKLAEIELNFKTKVIFADDNGPDIAETLFKYVNMKYQKDEENEKK